MAKVGAQRASELTGKSKSTVQRAMNTGKLSFEIDNNNRRVIDVSELDRVFGLKNASSSAPSSSVEQELEKASQMIESERMKMRIKMLEEQLYMANSQIDDLREQRDKWQRQADQVLITSQASQKQAEELRTELKERERKAQVAREERRQKILEERMGRLKGQNENARDEEAQDEESGDGVFNFQGLWKRVKGQ